MKIKQDPVSTLYCRSDGAVLMPPTGRQYKLFRWTFGSMKSDDYRAIQFQGKHYFVHQIVCRAFHGLAPEDKPFVDHINRIKGDNRPENLRWVSNKENCDNKDRVDRSIEKFGVRCCDDRTSYNKAWRESHRGKVKAYNATKYAKMKAQGLVYRKGPDGKHSWFPRIRA